MGWRGLRSLPACRWCRSSPCATAPAAVTLSNAWSRSRRSATPIARNRCCSIRSATPGRSKTWCGAIRITGTGSIGDGKPARPASNVFIEAVPFDGSFMQTYDSPAALLPPLIVLGEAPASAGGRESILSGARASARFMNSAPLQIASNARVNSLVLERPPWSGVRHGPQRRLCARRSNRSRPRQSRGTRAS